MVDARLAATDPAWLDGAEKIGDHLIETTAVALYLRP
jgi:hypothetical protein